MRNFLYIGRLSRSQLTPLNQALFGRYIRRLGLGRDAKIRGAYNYLPQFGLYIVFKYRIIKDRLYVDEAELKGDFGSNLL